MEIIKRKRVNFLWRRIGHFNDPTVDIFPELLQLFVQKYDRPMTLTENTWKRESGREKFLVSKQHIVGAKFHQNRFSNVKNSKPEKTVGNSLLLNAFNEIWFKKINQRYVNISMSSLLNKKKWTICLLVTSDSRALFTTICLVKNNTYIDVFCLCFAAEVRSACVFRSDDGRQWEVRRARRLPLRAGWPREHILDGVLGTAQPPHFVSSAFREHSLTWGNGLAFSLEILSRDIFVKIYIVG